MVTWLQVLLTFVLLAFILLLCARLGRQYLFAYSVGCILVSNITLVKQIEIAGWSMSLGVVIYSVIYLATDICSEYGDRHDAWRLAFANLAAQIAFVLYMQLTLIVPPTEDNAKFSEALVTIFSTTPRITSAAVLASVGAFIDIAIYEWLKRQYVDRERSTKSYAHSLVALVVRNNLSTVVGQGVNTAVFFFVAFYGVLPEIGQVIVTAWLVKAVIALVDTPFLALARHLRPDEWSERATWAS